MGESELITWYWMHATDGAFSDCAPCACWLEVRIKLCDFEQLRLADAFDVGHFFSRVTLRLLPVRADTLRRLGSANDSLICQSYVLF